MDWLTLGLMNAVRMHALEVNGPFYEPHLCLFPYLL
jgi:hypothetical protein